jgi:hypothetical protein
MAFMEKASELAGIGVGMSNSNMKSRRWIVRMAVVGLMAMAMPMAGCGELDEDLGEEAEEISIEEAALAEPPGDGDFQPAGNGDRTVTTSCGAWTSPASGTPHASINRCNILWGKNDLDVPVLYWQKVTIVLEDKLTDGACARAEVAGIVKTECAGAPTTRSFDLGGRRSSIGIKLSWNGNQPVTRSFTAPSGF